MNIRGVAGDTHGGTILDRFGDYDVIQCHSCGFTHVRPIPSDEMLEAIYRDEYYTREKPDYFKHVLEDQVWWDQVYTQRYRDLEHWLPPEQRTLLDIGSGPGLFLLAGARRGWQTTGVEPSQAAVDFSRRAGCRVIHGFLSEKNIPSGIGHYHCAHLADVLEHLPNPAVILGGVRSLLHPGGLIHVTVPNDYSKLQSTVRALHRLRPWWVGPPHHINHFTFSSIKALLKRCGFTPLRTRASFPMELFLLAGWNYVVYPRLGRKCHAWRKRFELRMTQMGLGPLQNALYQMLAAVGMGREITIIARKAKSI